MPRHIHPLKSSSISFKERYSPSPSTDLFLALLRALAGLVYQSSKGKKRTNQRYRADGLAES